MARIGKAEKERRVTEVAALLLKGVKRAQILEYARKNAWGVKRAQVDTYIADATATIKESAVIDRDFEIARTAERYEYLYAVNLSRNDYREARAVIKAKSDLLGIEAPKAVENRNYDMTQLPKEHVKRIADGEPPDKVFADFYTSMGKDDD